MNNIIKTIIISILTFVYVPIFGQNSNVLYLDLNQTIEKAQDSSLTAFRYKNMYLSNYWSYRNYKANRLPSLSLNLVPVSYNRQLIQRYDSENDIDVYRQQKSYSASGSLMLSQNFDPLGGTFFIQSSLDYLRYFGANTYNQFTSAPFSIGYQHNMFGFNQFKWDKKIEPLKFEKAKLQYLYNAEQIASNAVTYFFNLAQAQVRYKNAINNAQKADTTLIIAERRFKIASITKTDLMDIQLEIVNAKNEIAQAEVDMQKASLALTSFLGIDKSTKIELILPENPNELIIDNELALEYLHKNSYQLLENKQSVLEAEKEYDRIKKSNRMTISVNANVGFNQQAEEIADAYKDLMRKDVISVSMAIPIMDWGMRKGQKNQAESNLNIAKIDQEQQIQELEQNLTITIGELNSRYNMLQSALTAQNLANEIYQENILRFQEGSCNITTLTSSQQRMVSAQNNYISSLYQYWYCYYNLRQQTLFDFDKGISLSEQFDFDNLR
ncbi:MAG: TolC family protein [Bacteroidales bacterium]|nr:TolC family protein [Bacteroidales bacterium]